MHVYPLVPPQEPSRDTVRLGVELGAAEAEDTRTDEAIVLLARTLELLTRMLLDVGTTDEEEAARDEVAKETTLDDEPRPHFPKPD